MAGKYIKPLISLAFLGVSAWAGAQGQPALRVLSGGAAKALVQPMTDSFRGAGGESAQVEYQPMGTLVKSLAAGVPVDVVVVTEEVLAALQADGKLPRGAGRPIARVGVGVAVNERAPLPDISNADAFRRTLLAAKSIVYINPKTGTSGKHVAEVLARLGIAGEVNAKATLAQGGYIVEPVGRGEIELGIHQISEILPVKGVRLVGPLPPELQKYTVYVAVPVPATGKRALADAYIGHLVGPQARERLAAAGYTAPQ